MPAMMLNAAVSVLGSLQSAHSERKAKNQRLRDMLSGRTLFEQTYALGPCPPPSSLSKTQSCTFCGREHRKQTCPGCGAPRMRAN